jgi:hypothetical protein
MKTNKPFVIGLGSIARCGKDSCFNILSKYLNAKRFSFADELKEALNPLCMKYHGISAFTQNDSAKNVLRPLMVEFGCSVRACNRRAWIDKVKIKMEAELRNGYDYFVITDLRFDEFEDDEYSFVKKELNGLVVNVDRIMPNGKLLEPSNMVESRNYYKIKDKSDVSLLASDLDELEEQIIGKILPILKEKHHEHV